MLDKEIFLDLLVAWAEHEKSRKRFNQKIREVGKKAGISKQVLSYHLKKFTSLH